MALFPPELIREEIVSEIILTKTSSSRGKSRPRVTKRRSHGKFPVKVYRGKKRRYPTKIKILRS